VKHKNKKDLKVLHTSDLHLEFPGDRGCECLRGVVNLALEEEVDMLISAGDLFDHGRVEDEVVSFAVEQLKRLNVPVILLPGNHDCLISGSAYDREALWENSSHIQLITEPEGEMLELPELGISIWGKSIASLEENMRPLEGIPRPVKNGDWYIALAHGYFVDNRRGVFPSYHITEEEITNCGWDYIAMGHIPLFRCVCAGPVKAYYSGSPTITGGVAMIELSRKKGVNVSQCPLVSTIL
jgi:DNA repair exonuclease SbcCD nuclease subunit